MMKIIEQDGIPLINCRNMLTDSSSIALVKHAPRMTYAAISHVSFQHLYYDIPISVTTIAVDCTRIECFRCSRHEMELIRHPSRSGQMDWAIPTPMRCLYVN